MTYRELLDALKYLPKDRLDATVKVYNTREDEFFAVSGVAEAVDYLDHRHLFLTMLVPDNEPYEL
jgi:hypothetical protein